MSHCVPNTTPDFVLMKEFKLPPTLTTDLSQIARPRQFSDTDPQMLFALWNMELGVDPDRSLDEVQNAVVVYDKFRPSLRRG
jgi:hypothetical protein